MTVNDRTYIRHIKACNQSVQYRDVRHIAGRIDTDRMAGAASLLYKISLALRSNAALASGLLNQLSRLQRIQMTGCLGMYEMQYRFTQLLRIGIHVHGFPQMFFRIIAPQNRILDRHAPFLCQLRQLIHTITAAHNAGHFSRIRSRKSNDFSVLIQIWHLHAEDLGIGADCLNIFFYNSLCVFLHNYALLPFLLYPPIAFGRSFLL